MASPLLHLQLLLQLLDTGHQLRDQAVLGGFLGTLQVRDSALQVFILWRRENTSQSLWKTGLGGKRKRALVKTGNESRFCCGQQVLTALHLSLQGNLITLQILSRSEERPCRERV